MGRTKKGEISINIGKNGIDRLRWRYRGERYSLNVPHLQSSKISARIKLDIVEGKFDTSLLLYKRELGNSEAHNNVDDLKSSRSTNNSNPSVSNLNIPDLYIKWIKNYKHGNLDNNSNYSQVLVMIRKWSFRDPVQELNDEVLKYTTYNRRLTTLTQFYDWLVSHNYLNSNPFTEVSPKKVDNYIFKSEKRKPLTSQEINKVISQCKKGKYSKHYADFLYFMFRTGVRNEEGIGLRVKHIDFAKNTIHICEVMARGREGTNAKYRKNKPTKTGKNRFIPLDSTLRDMLERITFQKSPNDLVFTSPKGLCIDDRMFQKRILRPIFEELKIPCRDLYAARHSFASRSIEAGIPLATVAYLMGNSPETLVKVYTDITEKPDKLPDL